MGPDAIEWQEAIDYEISQLESLTLGNRRRSAPWEYNPVHYVLATKRGPDGQKLKLRARLVTNGQHQQYGLDYSEHLRLLQMSTIRTVLTVAAQRNWESSSSRHSGALT